MKYNLLGGDEDTVLTIEGTLDAVSAPDLRQVVDRIVAEERRRVRVDLSSVRIIDSSGVGVLVSLFKRLRASGGEVELVGLRDQPLQIFRLLRLDKVFPM